MVDITMSESDRVEDPLRPLDEIFQPDKRHITDGLRIENVHEVLSKINLIDDVPVQVRQLFETAKNVSLYSWFFYRFHQVAELVAFSALEMALKDRYYKENPDKDTEKNRISFAQLLRHAEKEKWIENRRFSFGRGLAHSRVLQKKEAEIIQSGILKNPGDSVPLAEPTEEEINQEMDEIDIVGGIVQAQAKIRNDLAHGSTRLDSGSISRLMKTAEIINQVYA